MGAEKFVRNAEAFRIPETSFSTLLRPKIHVLVCQSVISGGLTLRDTKIREFGVKF